MSLQAKIANIPLLKAEDIDLRVGRIDKDEKWLTLLLYKNARIDMQILDDVFGTFGWSRGHKEIKGNLFCVVNLWDGDNKQWVPKEDVGTESNTEAEKGEASDSFKRACVNVGIGRELYTAPFIRISGDAVKIKEINGKKVCKDRFVVTEIDYTEDRKIRRLVISKDEYNNRIKVFEWENLAVPKVYTPSTADEKKKADMIYSLDFQFIELAKLSGKDVDFIIGTTKKRFNINGEFSDLTVDQLETVYNKVIAWVTKAHEDTGTN